MKLITAIVKPFKLDFVPTVRVETASEDADVDELLDVITQAAWTGKIGEEVWVTDIDRLLRIRTGEVDADAL